MTMTNGTVRSSAAGPALNALVKWLRSGSPAAPDAGTEASDAPFQDNQLELIDPQTMRNFAYELGNIIDQYGAGTVGPQGPAGMQGPAGPRGPEGPRGIDGTTLTFAGMTAWEDLPVTPPNGVMYVLATAPPEAPHRADGSPAQIGDGVVYAGGGVWTNVGPIQGPPGAEGAAGDEITNAYVGANGNLAIEMSDGRVLGPFPVRGPQGTSVTAARVGTMGSDAGVLILTLNNPATSTTSEARAGLVVGPPATMTMTVHDDTSISQPVITRTGSGTQADPYVFALALPYRARVFVGQQDPVGSNPPVGQKGDVYLYDGPDTASTLNGDLFVYDAGWTKSGNLAGPHGPAGPAGAQGPVGPALTVKFSDTPTHPIRPSSIGQDAAAAYSAAGQTPKLGDLIIDNVGGGWIWTNAVPGNVSDPSNWQTVGPIRGPQGVPGSAGAQGAQGATGQRGADGAQGAQGPPGTAGATGPAGAQGTQGAQGAAGTSIVSANVDASGNLTITLSTGTSLGPWYVRGPAGQTGSTGPAGVTGAKGDRGDPGSTGIQGPSGAKGDKGDKGDPGAGVAVKGSVNTPANLPPTGNSVGDAYIVQSDGHMYVWDGTKWVDSGVIRGPQGPTGPTGPQGLQGVKGDTGATGPAGATGTQGVAGAQGVAGVKGDQGPIGLQGPAGSTGAAGPTGTQGVQGPKGDTITSITYNPATGMLTIVGTGGASGGPFMVKGADGAVGAAGPAGPTGPAPTIAATATTIAAGSPATATVTPGGPGAYTVSFGIPQGAVGAAGTSVILKGSVNNWNNLPASPAQGDLWVTTPDCINIPAGQGITAGDGVVWDGTKWASAGPIRGPQGSQGPTGAVGATGATGAQGVAGATGATGAVGKSLTVTTSTGAPTGTPSVPAQHINTATGEYWVVNTGTTWPASPTGNIRGPMGPKGDKGDPGIGIFPKGSTTWDASNNRPTYPSGYTPVNGDTWTIQDPSNTTVDRHAFVYQDGTWIDLGNLGGPQGPAGFGIPPEFLGNTAFEPTGSALPPDISTPTGLVPDGAVVTYSTGSGGYWYQFLNGRWQRKGLYPYPPPLRVIGAVTRAQLSSGILSVPPFSTSTSSDITFVEDLNATYLVTKMTGAGTRPLPGTGNQLPAGWGYLATIPPPLKGDPGTSFTYSEGTVLPAITTAGNLFYNTNEFTLYVSSGTEWRRVGPRIIVSTAPPPATLSAGDAYVRVTT